MVELSIIIVNWNTKDLLKDCLKSIYQNTPDSSFEVIVVDNGSTDGSQEMVKSDFPQITLIENVKNVGYSCANNIGFRYSKGKYVLFLNSDTLVHKDTLNKAVKFMKEHEDAGVMGCKTLDIDGRIQYSAFSFPSLARIFAYITGLNRLFKISKFKNFSKIRSIEYVQGSFLMIGRELFERLSGFDEKFFMYNEDVDLCERVWKNGWKVYFNPNISITHYLGGSSKKSPEILKEYIQSSIYLYKKHKKAKNVLILKFVILLAILTKVIFQFLGELIRLKIPRIKSLKFLVKIIPNVIKG